MSDGKIRIDTTLETKNVAKSFKDLENMAKRTANKLKGTMSTGKSAKELEQDLKAQQKIIQQAEKEISKYQEQLDNLDGSKIVASLQSKIDAENKTIEDAKAKLESYLTELNKVQEKAVNIKAATVEQVRNEQGPEMLAANPKLESYETSKKLAVNPDYQDAIAKEQELFSEMRRYDSAIEKASASVAGLKNQLESAKNEQKEMLNGKISKLSQVLEKAKKEADSLSKSLAKAKGSSDISSGAKKSSNALSSAGKSAGELGNHVKKTTESGVKRFAKLALAIFSVRSAYTFARRAADEYLQSNEQLSGQVQGIWNALAQAIGPVVQTIVGWIVTLVSYINAFIKSLTGIDFVAKGNAAALDKQAASTSKVAKATEKAKRQLAGFDEMEVLSKDKTDGGDAGGGGGGTSAPQLQLDPVNLDALDGLKKKMEELFEPIKNAWDKYGKGFVDSFKYGLGEVWELVKSIGSSFEEVWTNGTGEETVSLILQILSNIFKIIGNIAQNFRKAWEEAGTGTKIIQNVWDVVNILLGGVKDVTSSLEKWSKDLDFGPFLKSIEKITGKLKPFAKLISEDIKWAFDHVLLPLGKWTIESALPAVIDLVSGALDVLYKVCEAASDTFKWLWENFLEPIASWTGGVIVDVLEGIADMLEGIANNEIAVTVLEALGIVLGTITFAVAAWTIASTAASLATTAFGVAMNILTSPITLVIGAITAIIAIILLLVKHWDEVKEAAGKCWDWICEKWEQAGEFFAGIWDSICDVFSGIGDWFKDKFESALKAIKNVFSSIGTWFGDRKKDIENVFSNIGTWFKEKFNNAITGIKNVFANIGTWFGDRKKDIENVFKNIASWFGEKFGNAWKGIKNIFSLKGVKEFFGNVWSGIKNAFGNITEWFRDKFSKAWTAVKNVFSSGGKVFDGIKDGILNGLKAVINALISGINRIIKIPFDGINSALNGIKDISILGHHPFDWIPTISVPQIPKLAKGGIVNRPGPGVNMGDYIAGERSPEAILPLKDSEFIKMFAKEVASNMGGEQPVNIVLKIGDKEFYRWFINMKKKYDFVMNGG